MIKNRNRIKKGRENVNLGDKKPQTNEKSHRDVNFCDKK